MRIYGLILLFLCGLEAAAESKDLMATLTERGVTVVGAQTCVLAKPSLLPELDADERKVVLDRLAGGRGWKHFSRDSTSAPVAIKVQYLRDDDGERIGHVVHSAFIVHTTLERLKDADLMEQLFLNSANSKDAASTKEDDETQASELVSSELTSSELASVGIHSVGDAESYGLVELPLLKKVLVRGVMRTERTIDDDSVTLAWELDPRFTGAPAHRNTWSATTENDAGDLVAGNDFPYQGVGGYLHLCRLSELEDACLVEMRFVLHEPKEWFRGSAQLRSKLPLLLQQGARKFRRTVVP